MNKNRILLIATAILTIIITGEAQTQKSDANYELGMAAYEKGDYKKAERYFRITWEEDSVSLPEDNIRRSYSYDWLNHTLYKLGRKKEARVSDPTPEIRPLDRRKTVEIDTLSAEARRAYGQGTPSGLMLAELKYDAMLRAMERTFGPDCFQLGVTNLQLTSMMIQAGKFTEALRYAERGDAIVKKTPTENRCIYGILPLAQGAVAMGMRDSRGAIVKAATAREYMKGNMHYIPWQYSQMAGIYMSGCYAEGDTTSVRSTYNAILKEYLDLGERERASALDVCLELLDDGGLFGYEPDLQLIAKGIEACAYLRGKGTDVWGAESRILEKEMNIHERRGEFSEALKKAEKIESLIAGAGEVPPWIKGKSLGNYARLLMRNGKKEEAYAAAEKCLAVISDSSEPQDMERKMEVECYLGELDFFSEKYQTSLSHYERAAGYAAQNPYIYPALLGDIYHHAAAAANRCNNEEKFISYLKKSRNFYEQDESCLLRNEYFDCCLNLAEYEAAKGNKQEPVRSIDELERMLHAATGIAAEQKAVCEANLLVRKGRYYKEQGDNKKGYECMLRGIEEYEKVNLDVPGELYEGAMMYLPDDSTPEEYEALSNRMLADAAKWGERNLNYASALIFVGRLYGAAKMETVDARRYLNEAESILREKEELSTTPNYMRLCNRLFEAYINSGEAKAAKSVMDYMESHRTADNRAWICEGCYELNRMETLTQLGEQKEGLELYKKIKRERRNHSDHEGDELSLTLRMANWARQLGMVNESLEWYDLAISLLGDPESWNAEHLMMMMPYFTVLNQTGYTEERSKYAARVMNRMQEVMGEDSNFSAMALVNQIMMKYAEEGPYETFLFMEEKLNENKEKYGIYSVQSVMAHTMMSSYGASLTPASELYPYLEPLYRAYQSEPGQINNMSPEFLLNYAKCAGWSGRPEEGLEALDMMERFAPGNRNMLDYITLHSTYGTLYNMTGEREKSYANYRLAFDRSREYVLDNFLNMTSEERASFWNQTYSYYRQELPLAASWNGFTPRYSELLYDAALFSSGLLLASDVTMAEAVAESKDRSTRKLYDDYQKKRTLYVNATEGSSSGGELTLMKKELKEAEKKVMSRLSDRLGQYNRRLAISWEDVRKSLGEKEAAVEFVEVPNQNATTYMALILRKEYTSPVGRILFTVKAEESAPFEQCYSERGLYEALWAPMAKELAGCSTVWFAPQGKLTVTAIESLPGLDELTDRDGTEFRRVTSTRELVRDREKSKGKGAVVYGDIDFSLSGEALVKASRKGGKREILTGSREAGGGLGELPGTREEAEYLAELLKKHKDYGSRNMSVLMREKATETSFKDITGTRPRIIHVGTHGFYADDESMRNSAYFSRKFSGEQSPEDLAMMRSGLLFAGAEGTLLDEKEIPESVDNGILTAHEIAAMNLSGTELIVMSACETGLGEVGSDGVFGLQRGLKKAGAGAILMSLWKVSDEATTVLMKSFYRHWLEEGKSKYEALESAKREVRNRKGWERAEYWAPFIMVDNIEAFD